MEKVKYRKAKCGAALSLLWRLASQSTGHRRREHPRGRIDMHTGLNLAHSRTALHLTCTSQDIANGSIDSAPINANHGGRLPNSDHASGLRALCRRESGDYDPRKRQLLMTVPLTFGGIKHMRGLVSEVVAYLIIGEWAPASTIRWDVTSDNEP